MRLVLPLLFLALVSCGKTTGVDDQRLNTTNSLVPEKLRASELETLRDICDALSVKTTTIGSLVNTTWVFSGTEKSCTDETFRDLPDATVSLLNQNGTYAFGTPASLFYFSDVETSNDGILSRICSKLSNNLTSPLDPAAATDLIYLTTEELSTPDCPAVTDESCVKIERAVTVNTSKGPRGRVHSREWIRVRIAQPKLGFYTYRKRISVAGCDEEAFLGRTATLK